MNRNDLNNLKKWFADYASSFYAQDHEFNNVIKFKEAHTERVCKNIIMIGTKTHMPEEDLILAEASALFHDVGRFMQYKKYGTFNDRRSENHAVLGLRQMAVHKVLSMCTKNERAVIVKAIYYHNTISIPTSGSDRRLNFIRFLRDADKIDIWKVFSDYYHGRNKQLNKAIELDLPDIPEYSKEVIQALREQRIARMEKLISLNDFKLLQIGWVFDLNFTPSFQAVSRENIIERLEAALPKSKEISEAVRHAKEYVQSRL